MNDNLERFCDIIDFWPSCAAFGRAIGVKAGTARKMRERDNISPEYWLDVVKAASTEEFAEKVTLDKLALIASNNKQNQRRSTG